MNTNIDITQDTWFDPFATKRPTTSASAPAAVASGWCPAALLTDPGDDPSDDADPAARV